MIKTADRMSLMNIWVIPREMEALLLPREQPVRNYNGSSFSPTVTYARGRRKETREATKEQRSEQSALAGKKVSFVGAASI